MVFLAGISSEFSGVDASVGDECLEFRYAESDVSVFVLSNSEEPFLNHWIVATNEMFDDLVALCDHASDRQQDAEACEREYKKFLEEVGLDPAAVNNRGIEVVEE